MDAKSVFDKLEKIYKQEVLADEDIAFLLEHATNEDEENRYLIAELLINVKTEESKNALLALTKDESWLVRANAYDSLSVFDDENVVDHIKASIKKEKRATAKSYAIMAVGDILKRKIEDHSEDIRYFKDLQAKEKSAGVKMAYYYTLYLLGEKEYIHKLIAGMDNKAYHMRCACVNMLSTLLNEENKDIILEAMEKRYLIEDVPAVLSGIKLLISEAKTI